MKKIMFATFCILIASFCTSITGYAQSSKVEDFIKKYSSQKGASYVEMSTTMLDAAFANKSTTSHSQSKSITTRVGTANSDEDSYPQKFKSLVLSETSKANELNQILKGKDYEKLMETQTNREDRTTKESYAAATTYYFYNASKADEKEIIIVQQEGDKRLSITYMQGKLDVDKLQSYLIKIRVKLNMMGVHSGLTSELGMGTNLNSNYSYSYRTFGGEHKMDTRQFMFNQKSDSTAN